jgi:hypothetical protein
MAPKQNKTKTNCKDKQLCFYCFLNLDTQHCRQWTAFFYILVMVMVSNIQGRIQDFVFGGTKVGEGSGDRLRSPAGQGRALVGSPVGRKLLGFEYLGSFSVNNFETFCECDEVYENARIFSKTFQIVSKQ